MRVFCAVALCLGAVAGTVLAQDVNKVAAERHDTTIYSTFWGARISTIYSGSNIPPGQRIRVSEPWWATDTETVQKFLGVTYAYTTSTSLAMVTGAPGTYTMPTLARALGDPPFNKHRTAYPDLASTTDNIFVAIDIDNFVMGGGGVPPPFTPLTVLNGVVVSHPMPGLLVSTMPFNFSPATGWTSPGLLTGSVDVIGELGLTPRPVMDGSASDVLYDPNIPLAYQDTQTNFGDASLGRPDVCNGSELDGAYATVYGGTLYMVLAGNFETNGNKLEIFFDTVPGGQNQLLGTNPGYPLQRMSEWFDPNSDPNVPSQGPGLKFAGGFEADYYLSVNAFGSPVGLYVDYAKLYVDANDPGVAYYCGAGSPKCGTSGGVLTGADPNAPAILCTADNSNVGGVTGGTSYDLSGASALVKTGIELAIPLSAIGYPDSFFDVCVFINGQQHDYVSNQILGGLFGSVNLGEPRMVDLTATAHVPFTIPVVVTPVGACCIGSTCSITTQAACGGTYMGDNTNCDGNPCTPAYGRCCIDDGYAGQCRVVEDAGECATLGGTFTANETCYGCPCLLAPKGACCNGTTCSVTTEALCTGGSGNYVGDFTTCSPTSPCDAGACCATDLTCTEVRRFECTSPNNFFAGTLCSSNPCAAPTINNPHVAGDMQGWDPTSTAMTETPPGSGIWTYLFTGLLAGSRHEFKITNGSGWPPGDPNFKGVPAANSWCFADPNGDLTITYNSNYYADGWSPARDRLPFPPYSDPGTWTAVGSWQNGVPGDQAGDWLNNDPTTVMTETPPGSHIYMCQRTGLAVGSYIGKTTRTGSWDAMGSDGRSVDAHNFSFSVADSGDTVQFWVNALDGTAKVVVIAAPTGACCDGPTCSITTAAACLLPKIWKGAGTDCFPNPCIPINYYWDLSTGEKGGDGYNNGEWIPYPNAPGGEWWNMWWLNDYYLDRQKEITVTFTTTFPAGGTIDVALNWSTPDWTDDTRPPLGNEEQYIQRYFLGTFTAGGTETFHHTLSFCPRWVSIDIRGTGFTIEGTIEHICVAPQTGACCAVPALTCTVTQQAACLPPNFWKGAGTLCTTPNICGCKASSNCDLVVSWRDIDYFVAAMNDAVSAWYRRFLPNTPSCSFWVNDVNNDYHVSWRDITPFVQKMNMTCPHP